MAATAPGIVATLTDRKERVGRTEAGASRENHFASLSFIRGKTFSRVS